MALVTCPGCSKRVSDVLSMCPDCGHVRGEVDDERMVEMKRRGLRDRIYHLKMISYVVISLFLVAFGWYWWDSAGFTQPSSRGPFILMGAAALGYVVVRGLLFRLRQQRKEMRRNQRMGSDLRRNL